MSTPMGPQFFCSRPNGSLTPLIAVDELPSHITIRGVPRVLSPADTQGMTSLGSVSQRPHVYVIDTPVRPGIANTSGHAHDYELQSSLSRAMSEDIMPANQRVASQTMMHQAPMQQGQNWAMPTPTLASNNWMIPAVVGPSTGGATGHKKPNANNAKKEYCSYWIRHGECDYQQQGCLFKHEMPTDPAMLEKLGLRDIPRWYRDKYGVRSLLSGGQNRSHGNNNIHSQNWREDSTVKAIQYPTRVGINDGFHAAESDKDSKPKGPNFLSQPHGSMIPDQPRAFAAMNQHKGPPTVQKTGPKTMSNQSNPHGMKLDLLSFDPVHDYTSHSQHQMGASTVGERTYASTAATIEQVLPIEAPAGAPREGLVRDMQTLMPPSRPSSNADRMQNPADLTPCPVRTKRTQPQQSRRLYQQRSFPAPQEAEDSFPSWKGLRTALPSMSKGGSQSQMQMHVPMQMPMSMSMGRSTMNSPTTRGGAAGGIMGSTMSSDVATRPASPERSSLSSGSSNAPLYLRGQDHESKHHSQHQDPFHHPPGVIGTKPARSQRKESHTADKDLIGFGSMGRR